MFTNKDSCTKAFDNWSRSKNLKPKKSRGVNLTPPPLKAFRVNNGCVVCKGPCKRSQHCWPTTLNIVGPDNVVTCFVRLHGTTTMLALVAYSLKPIKLLAQQVPTFLLFCDRRSVAQQCCARLHGIPTILASWKRLRTRLVIFFSKNKQSWRVFFFLDCYKHGVSSWNARIIWGNTRR